MIKKSCKGSKCLAYEEKLIDEIDPHQESRSGKFNRAIEKAIGLSDEELKKSAKELKIFKNSLESLLNNDISGPTAMQVKVDDETLENDLLIVETSIKRALDLRVLQTRYEIELLWFIYLNHLKKDVLSVGERNLKKDLTGPEMVQILVTILMLNRESDKKVIEKVKNALLEWEE